MSDRGFKYFVIGAVLIVLIVSIGVVVQKTNRTALERCADSCTDFHTKGHWERGSDGHESCTCVKDPE